MVDKKVYSVTAQFESEIEKLEEPEVKRLGRLIVEIINEYEHGSADIEAVFEDIVPGIDKEKCLKLYCDVINDVLMYLDVVFSEENEK